MANFKDSPIFTNHDDYYTPKSAWKSITNVLDAFRNKHIKDARNLQIYEAFSMNSNLQSAQYLEELGYDVVASRSRDYLKDGNSDTDKTCRHNIEDYDIVVSNPPYDRIKGDPRDSLKYQCIEKLFEVGKPFIILMNSTNMFSKWWHKLIKGREGQIRFIFPTRKINYDKYKKGGIEKIYVKKNSCSFNTIYVCYKVMKNNLWI